MCRFFWISFLFLLFSFNTSKSQQNIIHDIPWESDTVGMWGPSSTVWSINRIDTLIDFSLGPYGDSYSFVYDFGIGDSLGVIFDYGASAAARAVFEMTGWSGGSVKVNYPTKVDMGFPADGSFSNGDWLTITSDYRELDTTMYNADNDKWELYSKWPEFGKIELYTDISINAHADIIYSNFEDIFNVEWDTMHLFNPVNVDLDHFDIFLIDIPNGEYKIPWVAFHNDPITGNPVIDSVYFLQDSIGWPLHFPDIFYELIGISGDISIPSIQTNDWIEDEQRLYAWGNCEYLHINLDIVKFVQQVCHYMSNIPQFAGLESVSQAIAYEEGDTTIFIMTDPISGEDFTAHAAWDLIDMELLFTNTMNQTLAFCDNQEYSFLGMDIPPMHYPNVWNILNFAVPVDYQVYDLTNTLIEEGSSDSIKYGADYDLKIKYPCSDEQLLPITVSHAIDPWLTNMVRDTIDVDFYLKVLEIEYSIGTPSNPILEGSFLAYEDTMALGSFAGPPLFGPPLRMPWQMDGFFPDTTFTPDVMLLPNFGPLQIDTIEFQNVFCTGQSTGMANAIASGGHPPYQFVWTNGIDTISTTSNITDIPSGVYYVTVTDSYNCTVADWIEIIDINPELFTQTSGVDVLCHGNNTGSANVIASGGTPGYTYQWMPSGLTSTGINNLITGWYYVSVTDAVGCIEVDSIFINEPATLISTNIIPTHVICMNGSDGATNLTVSGGTPPYFYHWNNNSVSEDLVNIPAGFYYVTVTDNNHCIKIDSIQITQPDSLLINFNKTDVTCFGLIDGAIDAEITGGVPAYTYVWSNGSFNQDISGLLAGTYTLSVTDSHNCLTIDSINVTEPQSPLTSTTSDIPVKCFGGSDGFGIITISGGTSPYSYLWDNGQTSEILNSVSTGNYGVTITDAHGCKLYDTVFVSQPSAPLQASVTGTDVLCNGGHDGTANTTVTGGTQPYSYVWNSGQQTSNIVSLYPNGYEVTVTDSNQCTTTATVIITQPQAVVIDLSSDVHLCYGQSTNLSVTSIQGGTPPYSYVWTPTGQDSINIVTPLVTTSYFGHAVDSHGCLSNTKKIVVTVDPALTLNVYAGNDSVCPGDKVFINGVISGGAGEPYLVYLNDTIPGNLPFIVYPDSSTNYTVTVWDACHFNKITKSVFVYTYPLPSINFSADIYEGCQPLTVHFNEYSTDQGQTYVWDFDDGEYENLSLARNPIHTFNKADYYDVTLTVTSIYGCKNIFTGTELIKVYPNPIAQFDPMPDVATTSNPIINFQNYTINAIAYQWNFGDGNTSTLMNPSNTYDEIMNSYQVQLIATSDHDCTDTIIHKVSVNGEHTFYAPTAFSPNNDGVNDEFKVFGTGIDPDNFKLIIYDRFGENVFESNDINKGWDGSIKGKKQAPMGSFAWIAIYKNYVGEGKQQAGIVTLFY